ncbi:cell division protein ZapA [Rhodobacteraceae bacterium W635]|uniref:cell division protein ZapA n=1 Tax=Nioella halotolerans TaxID=2303578 RepID=UPI000E3C0A6E|nr:cell division protein ZapA [Rhodobacteraceae bacterium W635]
MPEIVIQIGGRDFTVACQSGEEPFLRAAAQMLDTEASVVIGQIGRMPSERMLMMAGLMLADKTAGLEEDLQKAEEALRARERALSDAEERLAERARRIAELENAPAPEPEQVSVPVIPAAVSDSLAEIAARAEALALEVEEDGQAE